MRVGVPKEVKKHEYRVSVTPRGVRELTTKGHTVFVETNAGTAIGISDDDYAKVGAEITASGKDVFEKSDLIIKVKEPSLEECDYLTKDQILFTYLHLAACQPQAKKLVASGTTAIAYETVTDIRGGLPLLQPMSEIAGRMSIQVAGQSLQNHSGGPGVLLAGVPGVPPARVFVLGGGVAGLNAAQMAIGQHCEVTIVDISVDRLRYIDHIYQGRIKTAMGGYQSLSEEIRDADVIVGAVLVPGASAPRLLNRADLGHLKTGSVLVDISIDQGGCFETSKPTTHDDPTFEVDGVIHYCVANIPGAVSRTSTRALTNVTLPYVLELAENGVETKNKHLRHGFNVQGGNIVHDEVARALA
jgi:alanine dehydrogenase